MNKVNDDSEPMIVTNRDDKNIVVMSQADYENMLENLYVFGSEANRKHIDKSLNDYAQDKIVKMKIEDL